MKKSIFVYWSGGLDSTALIYKLLLDGYSVKAGYIKYTDTAIYDREMIAIESILNDLKSYDFEYLGILTTVLDYKVNNNIILKQSFLWLLSETFNVSNCDTLAIGYIMNDDAISYINEINKINIALNGIRYKPIEIIFPLMKMNKRDVWNLLPKRLQSNVSWCEDYNKLKTKYCGKCNSCRTMDFNNLPPESPESPEIAERNTSSKFNDIIVLKLKRILKCIKPKYL